MNVSPAARDVLDRLAALGSERNRQGMARYGINTARALGVSMAVMRPMAREIGRNHGLALELWDSAVHEARILACLVDDPKLATRDRLDRQAADLDSWDLTDQFCNKLVVKTSMAWELAPAWAVRPEAFVRRAGFSLAAQLAVHDKKAPDDNFSLLLELVRQAATDERNFVKKAVNWALRQIGKRNAVLRGRAVALATELASMESKAARWIGKDALRELQGR